MVIAVDIRLADDDYRNFIYRTFARITKQYPQHSFIFISDKADDSFSTSQNSSVVVIADTKIPLLTKVLTDKKIAAVLKKNKADIVISTQTLSNTKIPQCLIYSTKQSAVALKKANVIIAFSEFKKKEIIQNSKIEADKINVIYPGVDETFQPLDFEEREKIKEQYAEGKEYFFCLDEISSTKNLLNLLKAFSLFKKRQKSGMQLLIASKAGIDTKFKEQLRLYKFKDDVKIFGDIPLTNITASAYAIINIPEGENFSSTPLEAMKSEVPVITIDEAIQHEICGEAALYVNINNHLDIAEKMMLIFKDEKLRSELINKGKEQVKKYSWDKAAEQLWQSIKKPLRNNQNL